MRKLYSQDDEEDESTLVEQDPSKDPDGPKKTKIKA